MDNLDFSEEEIQEQLAILGYRNIPRQKLHEFKQDLDALIQNGDWKSFASGDHKNVKPPAVVSRQTISAYSRQRDLDDLIQCKDWTTASGHHVDVTQPSVAMSKPSPPAYIKEKVGQCYIKSHDEGFFLHSPKGDHEKQVLTTCQNRDYGQQQRFVDSYAQHSVAPKFRLPAGAPCRLQVEPDPEEPEDTLNPTITDSYTSSPDNQGRRLIKRKVLRKHKGQSQVYDESFYSEDSEAASSVEERLAELDLSAPAHRDSDAENDLSSETEGAMRSAFESYIRGMSHAEGDLRPKPKSFIRPVMTQQNMKKSDPVSRYFEYKQFWEMYKLPGEKDRRDLRWEIRDRLAYQPPPPKPRRVFEPNTYVVPTEKKRSALRWQIKNDLANGLLPHKYSYRF